MTFWPLNAKLFLSTRKIIKAGGPSCLEDLHHLPSQKVKQRSSSCRRAGSPLIISPIVAFKFFFLSIWLYSDHVIKKLFCSEQRFLRSRKDLRFFKSLHCYTHLFISKNYDCTFIAGWSVLLLWSCMKYSTYSKMHLKL